MANEPTFNPNTYRDFDDASRRNRAVQDLFEPGSTFKVVTASAAIEEKVMPIDTMIDTNPGMIRVAGRAKPVTEASHHNYGVISFSDVIIRSSNVGAIKIGLRVGTERLSRFVGLFGFGHPVSRGLPRREPGHRVAALEVDRERARLGVHGLSGRRDATADGERGECGGQRRRDDRAARRPRRVSRGPALRRAAEDRATHHQRGHGRHAHRNHGGRGRGPSRHGDAGANPRLYNCGKDRHGRQARERALFDDRLQRVVRRLRAVPESGRRHHRRDRRAACLSEHRRLGVGARVQEDCRGDAAVSRCWSDRQSSGARPRGTTRAERCGEFRSRPNRPSAWWRMARPVRCRICAG